jgi:hypothetical protein
VVLSDEKLKIGVNSKNCGVVYFFLCFVFLSTGRVCMSDTDGPVLFLRCLLSFFHFHKIGGGTRYLYKNGIALIILA